MDSFVNTKQVDMGKIFPLPVVCPSNRVHQEANFYVVLVYVQEDE